MLSGSWLKGCGLVGLSVQMVQEVISGLLSSKQHLFFQKVAVVRLELSTVNSPCRKSLRKIQIALLPEHLSIRGLHRHHSLRQKPVDYKSLV